MWSASLVHDPSTSDAQIMTAIDENIERVRTEPVTQEELAAMVGASRERVNKAIASFVRLGWIEQGDRKYLITDREQLARRAR